MNQPSQSITGPMNPFMAQAMSPGSYYFPAPIVPVQPMPVMQYASATARATVAAVPYERYPFVTGLDEVVGLTPGAGMAPNFVYNAPSGHGDVVQCVTQTYGASSGFACNGNNNMTACAAKPGPCIDSVTRSLLSGLTPLLSAQESIME